MPGVRRVAGLVVTVALVTGCAGAGNGTAAGPEATVTVTVTTTATTSVVAGQVLTSGMPIQLPSSEVTPTPTQVPRLRLRVFRDGCGVVRSQEPAGSYQNLTWVFRDGDGFQVLGRNAAGETRYRYFAPGVYSVVLEAWAGDRYVPVSNKVTVHC